MNELPFDLADPIERGAAAGVVGAVAMAAAMGLDLSLTHQRTNELRLLGGLLPGLGRFWPVTGTLMHLGNGAALGALFGWVQAGLPGPVWARGLLLAQVENLALWPVLLVLDRIHPDVRAGRLQRFNAPGPFLAEVFRHAVFGLILGVAFERLTPTKK
jgi:hypothetical protein